MKTATEQLIELAERLNPTGVIGDGMVAEFHALAARARAEQSRPPAQPDYGRLGFAGREGAEACN